MDVLSLFQLLCSVPWTTNFVIPCAESKWNSAIQVNCKARETTLCGKQPLLELCNDFSFNFYSNLIAKPFSLTLEHFHLFEKNHLMVKCTKNTLTSQRLPFAEALHTGMLPNAFRKEKLINNFLFGEIQKFTWSVLNEGYLRPISMLTVFENWLSVSRIRIDSNGSKCRIFFFN